MKSRRQNTQSRKPDPRPRRTRQWELIPEKLLPEDLTELKAMLESDGAKNIEVYPGTWKAQTKTIFQAEGSRTIASFATPSDLLVWLEAGKVQGPLVIEAELPPVDAKRVAQQPCGWRDELTLARKHRSDGELAIKFGDAWEAVRFLAQENDPLVIEKRIENLWRLHPEAAEKLGLPKLPATVAAKNPTYSQQPPESAKGRRERGPDYETSRQRVELEDKLRSELGTIKVRSEKHATIEGLRKEFSTFELWKILSESEQRELLTEEFKPAAYARTLVTRKFGLTSRETIKKDRQKLHKANKQG